LEGPAASARPFEEFVPKVAGEIDRLWIEQRSGPSSAKREIERSEACRKSLVAVMRGGVPPFEVEDEMIATPPAARD